MNEPSFQLNSVYHLLGGQDALSASATIDDQPRPCSSSLRVAPVGMLSLTHGQNSTNPSTNSNTKFSLRNYPEDVNEEEIEQVEQFIRHLEACLESRGDLTPGDDDESLCTICYAYPALAKFDPCAHTSCRACVTQHLMNRTDCFFCKTTIKRVIDQVSGSVVYQAPSPSPDSSDQNPK